MRDSQVNDHRGISEEEEEGLSSLFILLKLSFYRSGHVLCYCTAEQRDVTVGGLSHHQ